MIKQRSYFAEPQRAITPCGQKPLFSMMVRNVWAAAGIIDQT